MIRTHPFALVDVFADAALSGNPLAVVGDADDLSDETMRRAAREFQQSETTFVLTPQYGAAHARLRSFTPTGEEVVGAGHNSLGAWWWIAEQGMIPLHTGANDFQQEIGDRVLPLSICVGSDGGVRRVTLSQPPAEIGNPFTNLGALVSSLGMTSSSALLQARVVSTGVAHLLVEVADEASLDDVRPCLSELREVLAQAGGQGCYVWCRGRTDKTAHARFFNPTVGIHEDSATGSAAGPLAGLLATMCSQQDEATIVIEQGVHVGRPSRLELKVDAHGVKLSGQCAVSVQGQFLM